MNEQDFYDLKINQTLYVNGEKRVIDYLAIFFKENKVSFADDNRVYTWKNIMDKCSLTPPKKKVKYYLWAWYDGGVWSVTQTFYKSSDEFLTKIPDDKKKRLDISIEV